MRTVAVSDMHMGSAIRADLLRGRKVRDILLAEIEGADRLVLLGDAVELRDRPLRDAIAIAGDLFSEFGEVMSGREIVVVPGNHDHYLVEPWLERRRLEGEPPLSLEHGFAPEGWASEELARLASGADLTFAYPGLWIRDDVYAMHGHYLDRHLTIPTLERLGVAMVERVLGIPQGGPDPLTPPQNPDLLEPDEYERVQAPVYALLYSLAQASGSAARGAGSPSARLWGMLSGGDTPAAKVRSWLLGSVAFPGAVGIANRLGFGPVRADLSADAITSAGIRAMGEVVERLGIEAPHIVYGHTHRRGPLVGESSAQWHSGSTRLHNTGSWVFSPGLIGQTSAGSYYWPGTIAVIEDDEDPELRHLLDDMSRDELASGH